MNWYITYNEPPNGLYESQVVEVVNFVSHELNREVRLMAYVPLRAFWKNRLKIRSMAPSAVVLPCLPRFIAYKYHYLILLPFLLREKPKRVVCRGSFATLIGIGLKSFVKCKVVMDARGLLYEEDREYGIFPPRVSKSIRQLEIDSLSNADEVTAVTSDMYDYWRSEYNLTFFKPMVIPCTVSDKLLGEIDREKVAEYRAEMGFALNDIILVYSGSTAPWQSLDKLTDWVRRLLQWQSDVKVLFLSKSTPEIDALTEGFPGRVYNRFVTHDAVPVYLACADYGLMLRTSSRTNSVGSPIKTAEYLLAGLQVITNRNMAVHRLIESENLGVIVDDFGMLKHHLVKPSQVQREHCRNKGREYFSKYSEAICRKYTELYD